MKKIFLLTFYTLVCTALTITPAQIASQKSIYPKNLNSCNLPSINSLLPFPFGQKSDALKIECIQEGYSPFELISFKQLIDREDIGRLELPHISLATLLGDSIHFFNEMMALYSNHKELKNFTIIPKLLFFKKSMHSIIGVELCFPKAEQEILKIERIALFFIQNITPKDSDESVSHLGFNRIALYNAGDLDNKMVIIGETHEQKHEIHTLLESVFKNIKTMHTITGPLISVLGTIVESLAESSIGLIIEESDGIYDKLTHYHGFENIASTALADKEYIFYNPMNKKALALVETIQKHKAPLTSNYYLYGSLMGYDKEHITFKYQFEEYLRSIRHVNADGTLQLPYNIPQWVQKHRSDINQWIKDNWEASFHYFYPKARKRYERDKKRAEKYLNRFFGSLLAPEVIS